MQKISFNVPQLYILNANAKKTLLYIKKYIFIKPAERYLF